MARVDQASLVAKQTVSLMTVLQSKDLGIASSSKLSRVFLGEGLGSIARKTYDRIMKWEYVDFRELCPKNPLEQVTQQSDTQKLVVVPGFEVGQVRQKPVTGITTWGPLLCPLYSSTI